jgi:hypothetical protein
VNEIETIPTYNGWVQVKATAQAEGPVHHLFEPSIENELRPIHGAHLAEMIAVTREEKK